MKLIHLHVHRTLKALSEQGDRLLFKRFGGFGLFRDGKRFPFEVLAFLLLCNEGLVVEFKQGKLVGCGKGADAGEVVELEVALLSISYDRCIPNHPNPSLARIASLPVIITRVKKAKALHRTLLVTEKDPIPLPGRKSPGIRAAKPQRIEQATIKTFADKGVFRKASPAL